MKLAFLCDDQQLALEQLLQGAVVLHRNVIQATAFNKEPESLIFLSMRNNPASAGEEDEQILDVFIQEVLPLWPSFLSQRGSTGNILV